MPTHLVSFIDIIIIDFCEKPHLKIDDKNNVNIWKLNDMHINMYFNFTYKYTDIIQTQYKNSSINYTHLNSTHNIFIHHTIIFHR